MNGQIFISLFYLKRLGKGLHNDRIYINRSSIRTAYYHFMQDEKSDEINICLYLEYNGSDNGENDDRFIVKWDSNFKGFWKELTGEEMCGAPAYETKETPCKT